MPNQDVIVKYLFYSVDFVIIWAMIYWVLYFLRGTRSANVLFGVIAVLLTATIAVDYVERLTVLRFLLIECLIPSLGIAILVIFQPEFRRGLEQIGRRGILTSTFRDVNKEEIYATVHKLVDAVDDFSSTRTGALIAIERGTMLNDIIETGVIVDAEISVRLLGNLFYEGSPLHDGAVIIRGVRIHAASCVLPLTNRASIGKNLGTRHRAGVGLSEVSDAFVIIVSEETGAISVARNGTLRRFLDLKTLEKMLLDIYLPSGDENDSLFSRIIKGGKKDE